MPLRRMASLMSRNELVGELVKVFAEEGPIETTETSKSWVFITPKWVYKLKKPVRDDLQDLVPLRARHDNTLTEIDLNRRLAPELYVGAVRVGRLTDGSLTLDRPGAETVDWMVKMHRLPKERMLDEQIVGGVPKSVLAARIDALMPVLVAFYRAAPKSRLNAEELMTVLEDQLETARHVLLDPLFADHHAHAVSIFETLDTLWPAITDRLDARVRLGPFVEGHGDLRPEHICLSDPPVIYDCLEFNRTLRLCDPFSEIAFLGMECAMLGADWIGPRMLAALETDIGPMPDRSLLRIYEALHAIVRTRLCFAHLLQPVPRTPEKWIPLGLQYLCMADRRLAQVSASFRIEAANAGAALTRRGEV